MSFGVKNPDELEMSMHEILSSIWEDGPPPKETYILRGERLDIIPSNINLAVTEINLRDETGGEHTLRELLNPLRNDYDYIIVDTNPYLGLLTKNALAACDEVIIPVSPQLWSAVGLTDLLRTISKIKRRVNPSIEIKGILMTMCDERTNLFKDTYKMLQDFCQNRIGIFQSRIPNTVRVGEANYYSCPVTEYDAAGKASLAYMALAKEVMSDAGEGLAKGCAQA